MPLGHRDLRQEELQSAPDLHGAGGKAIFWYLDKFHAGNALQIQRGKSRPIQGLLPVRGKPLMHGSLDQTRTIKEAVASHRAICMADDTCPIGVGTWQGMEGVPHEGSG